jgi:hypothetical protein
MPSRLQNRPRHEGLREASDQIGTGHNRTAVTLDHYLPNSMAFHEHNRFQGLRGLSRLPNQVLASIKG